MNPDASQLCCCCCGVLLLVTDGISLAEPESAGFFRVGQYGAVHTLEQRVNEMLLTIEV